MEKILWGRKPNYQAWQEDFLAETTTDQELQQATQRAIMDGYTEFRILNFTMGDKPDFTRAIQI